MGAPSIPNDVFNMANSNNVQMLNSNQQGNRSMGMMQSQNIAGAQARFKTALENAQVSKGIPKPEGQSQ